MPRPDDADAYGWDQFVAYAIGQGISLVAVEDFFAWWDCWKAGYRCAMQKVIDGDPVGEPGPEGPPGEEEIEEPPEQQQVCPHGNPPADCSACFEAGDRAYDASREDRFFGRG